MPDIPRDYNPRPDNSATAKQPAPTGNGHVVGQRVIADIAERIKVGKAKYGTELRTNNGRDALVDAYQEILDLAQYVKQELMERDSRKPAPAFNRENLLTQKEITTIEGVAICPVSAIPKILLLNSFAKALAR